MGVKRVLDFILSAIILFILCPLMLIIYILVKINLGSPVFFVQERIGKDNKVFKMIKFRSMKDAKDDKGNDLPDHMRVTKFGKVLRATSLDELPELINVLKGDMSLVGPRPLLIEYLPLYSNEQLRRHEVRPGVTGWAQINGRNSISWTQKFNLDLEYIDKWSLFFDIKILFLTGYKVIARHGINQDQNITMEYFNGSN